MVIHGRLRKIKGHYLGELLEPWKDVPPPKLIYLDLGSNALVNNYQRFSGTSIAFFMGTYPHARDFRIVAFEANPDYASQYEPSAMPSGLKHVVQFHSVAVGPGPNSTAWFRGRGYAGRVEATYSPGARAVQVLDFPDYLRRTISPEDFVVAKLDIEGGEWALLDALIETDTFTLIDELLFECHHRETRTIPTNRTWADCLSAMDSMHAAGIWFHEWF